MGPGGEPRDRHFTGGGFPRHHQTFRHRGVRHRGFHGQLRQAQAPTVALQRAGRNHDRGRPGTDRCHGLRRNLPRPGGGDLVAHGGCFAVQGEPTGGRLGGSARVDRRGLGRLALRGSERGSGGVRIPSLRRSGRLLVATQCTRPRLAGDDGSARQSLRHRPDHARLGLCVLGSGQWGRIL